MPGIAGLVARNRVLARVNYKGGRGPAGTEFDEFPYASTVQGGATAFGAYVPITENRSEGGLLTAFYRVALRNIPGSTFMVVDIP